MVSSYVHRLQSDTAERFVYQALGKIFMSITKAVRW